MTTTERLAFTLRTLATAQEVPGLHPEADREPFAVACIREVKAENDMLTEYDRAVEAEAEKVRIFQAGQELRATAMRHAFAVDILHQQLACRPATGILFTRPVLVNGLRLCLKWVA